MCRLLSVSCLALSMTFIAGPPVVAVDIYHQGQVVSLAPHKLIMSRSDTGSMQSYVIGKGVTIMLDGKTAKLSDLRRGLPIVIRTDDQQKVTRIEAQSERPDVNPP